MDTDEFKKKKKKVVIPRGEYVMLLAYMMNRNFEEHVALLWDEKVVFVVKVEPAHQFDIDPKGCNTKDMQDDSQMQ